MMLLRITSYFIFICHFVITSAHTFLGTVILETLLGFTEQLYSHIIIRCVYNCVFCYQCMHFTLPGYSAVQMMCSLVPLNRFASLVSVYSDQWEHSKDNQTEPHWSQLTLFKWPSTQSVQGRFYIWPVCVCMSHI